jgi:hypothetical protein
MTRDPRTIDEQIQCLARLTGAPDAFVGEVRALFRRRGISLAADAAPFLAALEDAFLREERMRTQTLALADASRSTGSQARKPSAVVLRAERESQPLVPGPDGFQ